MKKTFLRIDILFAVGFFLTLISCGHFYNSQGNKGFGLNKNLKDILTIKEIVKDKIISVKIQHSKIFADIFPFSRDENKQDLIMAALTRGIYIVSEKYNIKEIVPILYKLKDNAYTGGFLLLVEPKWSEPEQKDANNSF